MTRRPALTWPVAVAAVAGLAVLEMPPAVVLLALAVVVLAVGLLRRAGGAVAPSWEQLLGGLGFGAVAALALAVAPVLGAFLVGAGLLGHAIWDLTLHRRDVVVPRSMTEFCAVLDTAVGAVVLTVAVLSVG